MTLQTRTQLCKCSAPKYLYKPSRLPPQAQRREKLVNTDDTPPSGVSEQQTNPSSWLLSGWRRDQRKELHVCLGLQKPHDRPEDPVNLQLYHAGQHTTVSSVPPPAWPLPRPRARRKAFALPALPSPPFVGILCAKARHMASTPWRRHALSAGAFLSTSRKGPTPVAASVRSCSGVRPSLPVSVSSEPPAADEVFTLLQALHTKWRGCGRLHRSRWHLRLYATALTPFRS